MDSDEEFAAVAETFEKDFANSSELEITGEDVRNICKTVKIVIIKCSKKYQFVLFILL